MNMMKKTLIGISLAMMMSSHFVMATDDDGAKLYKKRTCNACHGDDAKTPLFPFYPKLAGQNKEYLIAQMEDIKNEIRKNGNSLAMKGVMDRVTQEDIVAIAEWLANLEIMSTSFESKMEKRQANTEKTEVVEPTAKSEAAKNEEPDS
jgi:cytochrome c